MSLTPKNDGITDYSKFRGKCKQLCDAAIEQDLSLTLVRGHYFCPIWNTEEQHWWTVKTDGSIYDPSARQFPSKGHGIYTPFNGIVVCDQCGKEIPEEEARFESRYAFCSYMCHGNFVGVF